MSLLTLIQKSWWAKLQIVIAILTILAGMFNNDERLETNEVIGLVIYNIFSVMGTACTEGSCHQIAMIRTFEPMLALYYVLTR